MRRTFFPSFDGDFNTIENKPQIPIVRSQKKDHSPPPSGLMMEPNVTQVKPRIGGFQTSAFRRNSSDSD